LRDIPSHEAPDIADFRKLMGRFATGVCIVAVEGGKAGVSGMTVNSFVSVSLEPMLVCWSLQNTSSQFDLYARALRFSISILTQEQQELALRYASRADSQLREQDFTRSPGGLPVVAGALGYMDCALWKTYPAGDHTMILGEVTDLAMPEPDANAAPLGFYDGRFCRIAE